MNEPEVDSKDVIRAPLSTAARYLAENGLPSVLAGPAGAAISRLIGVGVDIPVAYLERMSQRVRSRTEAEREIARAIAQETAKRASENDQIVDRASERWLGSEIRRQMNREAVAQKTIEKLAADNSDNDQPDVPNEDWLNYFEEYAEKASTDEMRDLWARILSGEIRNSGSFSLRTMNVMAMLDKESARAIESVFPFVFGGKDLPHNDDVKKRIGLENLLIAQDLGIIRGVGSFLILEVNNRIIVDGTNAICLGDVSAGFAVAALLKEGTDTSKLTFPNYPLTEVGIQLYKLVAKSRNHIQYTAIANSWKKNPHVDIVKLYRMKILSDGNIKFLDGTNL